MYVCVHTHTQTPLSRTPTPSLSLTHSHTLSHTHKHTNTLTSSPHLSLSLRSPMRLGTHRSCIVLLAAILTTWTLQCDWSKQALTWMHAPLVCLRVCVCVCMCMCVCACECVCVCVFLSRVWQKRDVFGQNTIVLFPNSMAYVPIRVCFSSPCA